MLQKYKILVVDDQRDNLLRIVEMIEEKFREWEILHALDGQSAIKISQKEKPDLILLDWEMPGLNGIETTKKLKENTLTSEIPVIICTGKMTSSKHLETALNAGAVDYIRKPVDKIELLARLQSMLLLSESYKRIKQLNENKNKILSIIAHDLKNPLYTVKLLMDLVNNQLLTDEKRKEILQGVSSSVASAFNLLENLLAWANSQRNTIIFLPEKFCLYKIFKENINLLQLDIINKGIVLDCSIDKELSVFADINMVSTIIRNLLSNAIKFTPNHGNIEISAKKADKMVEIFIKDNGIGISNADLKAILDENTIFNKRGTNKEMGSGIGLQLSRELILINNGTLTIRSKLNGWTHVTFTLPELDQNKIGETI
jgi:two-component system sensor histidine kinase/response regulator